MTLIQVSPTLFVGRGWPLRLGLGLTLGPKLTLQQSLQSRAVVHSPDSTSISVADGEFFLRSSNIRMIRSENGPSIPAQS